MLVPFLPFAVPVLVVIVLVVTAVFGFLFGWSLVPAADPTTRKIVYGLVWALIFAILALIIMGVLCLLWVQFFTVPVTVVGPTGPQGPQGPIGPTGPQGPAASIALTITVPTVLPPPPAVPTLAPTAVVPATAAPVVPPPAPVQPTPASANPPIVATPGYGLLPQPYVPHPSQYSETGHTGSDIEKTQNWSITVAAGTTLVYGGFRVNGEDGGVYGAIVGPTVANITVTDGFYSIVTNEWAQKEYCFRLGEAIRYNWAHAHVHPISGWSCQ